LPQFGRSVLTQAGQRSASVIPKVVSPLEPSAATPYFFFLDKNSNHLQVSGLCFYRINVEYIRVYCGQVSQDTRMSESKDSIDIKDRGGRRRLPDRRQFSSSEHFPERRNLRHRRSGSDRRTLQNLKMRKKIERRRVFKDKYANSK
jgi:hypothetical protein